MRNSLGVGVWLQAPIGFCPEEGRGELPYGPSPEEAGEFPWRDAPKYVPLGEVDAHLEVRERIGGAK